MAGWQLKVGKLNEHHLTSSEFWKVLNILFSTKAKNTTTYKFCFLKSILDNLFNCDEDLAINTNILLETMTEIYWNLIFINEIKQDIPSKQRKSSKMESIITLISSDYSILNTTPYEFLKNDARQEMNRRVSNEISKYVIGALYADTQGFN
ncbi:MAG: hypothetical protein JXQ26_01340 [Tissierellales bacterium]|nr:hypothetical protein [Tissierellales bacterium]MBN2826600.1 hypothetical protein [Tissierellales bacterium]